MNKVIGNLGAAAILAGCACTAANAFDNIVVNADLVQTDGTGGAFGWECNSRHGAWLEGTAGTDGVVTLAAEEDTGGYFRQYPVGLASGGRYRFSVEVRSALPAGVSFRFVCVPNEWSHLTAFGLPQDTTGAWQRVERTFAAPKSASPDKYFIGFESKGTLKGRAFLELRNLRLEAVDADSEAGVRRKDVSKCKRRTTARIVPIDPLLDNLRAKAPEITCFWPMEPACGLTNCTLAGTLFWDGRDRHRTASAKFAADGRAKLAFDSICVHRYGLALTVTDPAGATLATNWYWCAGRAEPPVGPAGRRLNNFVTELVNEELKSGECRFFRPTEGWVWISMEETDRNVRGYLDDIVPPVAFAQPDEERIETMRFVASGWHSLKVVGASGGRLRIHQVKRLGMPAWDVRRRACDFSGNDYNFGFPFVRRFLADAANAVHMDDARLNDPHDPTKSHYAARGIPVMGMARLPYLFPDRDDGEKMYRQLNQGAWANGWDCGLDENILHDVRYNLLELAEVLWRMTQERPHQTLDNFWGDASDFSYSDRKGLTALLSAVVNSGHGRGVLLPEVYEANLPEARQTDRRMDLFAKQVRQVGEILPGARDRTLLHLAPYLNMMGWTDEPCPETDIKALYGRMMHAFATEPRFAATAGFSTGADRCCEEETRRWLAKCQRYYCVEGGTNDLARQYGFAWNPGFVRNPDFMSGLEGWTALPAEGGSVRADRIAGYGATIQHRKKVYGGRGDAVAEFTATESGANRLVQKLTGLEPGRFYALRFCYANRTNTVVKTRETPHAFSVSIDGGERVEGLCYERHTRSSGSGTKVTGKGLIHLFHPRLVFKALSDKVTLTFSDRGPKGEKVAAGTKQILNYVLFRPYYCENANEPYEIARLMELKKEDGK